MSAAKPNVIPNFITPQPAIKWNYVSEDKLTSIQQNLFKQRSLPQQAKELVLTVCELADEYLEAKTAEPVLRL